jgi:thymidylate kinase
LRLAKDEPERVVVVDGSAAVEEIQREIIKRVESCLVDG